MPDKWAQYAAPAASGTDKWAQYAQPSDPSLPAGATGPLPGVPGIQKPELNYVPAIDSPKNLLTGAVSGVKNMVMHPKDTVAGMGQAVAASGTGMYPSTAATGNASDSEANAAVRKDALHEQGKQGNYAAAHPMETAGSVIGPALVTAGLTKALKVGAPVIGDAMQTAGGGVLNKTVGSLKNDFARGANPGRAYLDAGGGPAVSMDSLASKGSALKSKTGAKLGAMYDDATQSGEKIPVNEVTPAIRGQIQDARSVVTGPGGTGDTAPIRQFGASFSPPIQKAVAEGGFTPNDLWAVKKNVAQNTSWSDPTQIGMKSLRQKTAGAIGGVLSDALPETKPLNTQYQGLTNFAKRAQSRALTGSSPLTHIVTKSALGAGGAMLGATHSPVASFLTGAGAMALDSVPVKSTVGSGLYYGGRGVTAIGNNLRGLYAPALMPPSKR